MADIELVIKIDEKIYKVIKDPKKLETMYHASQVCEAIRKSTPLPKGHGRLIDADVLEKDIEDYSEGAFAMTPKFLVKDALTIIEADEESEE